MTTSLLLILIIFLVTLLIFWPGIIRLFYITFISGDRLQLIVTNNHEIQLNGKEKKSQTNLHIKIRNSGKNEIEIQAPVLEFVKGKKVRKFQPKLHEDTVYPLILNPKTYHEFNIDLNRIIHSKPELKKYRTVRIIFNDRENKNNAVKSIRIHY